MNTNRPLAAAAVIAIASGLLISCGSPATQSSPPAVTAAMAQSGAGQRADAATLATGRSLFIGRCARCHALPAVGRHSAQQWPGLVAQMAKRSGLQPDQRQAVLAYVLAARAQQ